MSNTAVNIIFYFVKVIFFTALLICGIGSILCPELRLNNKLKKLEEIIKKDINFSTIDMACWAYHNNVDLKWAMPTYKKVKKQLEKKINELDDMFNENNDITTVEIVEWAKKNNMEMSYIMPYVQEKRNRIKRRKKYDHE